MYACMLVNEFYFLFKNMFTIRLTLMYMYVVNEFIFFVSECIKNWIDMYGDIFANFQPSYKLGIIYVASEDECRTPCEGNPECESLAFTGDRCILLSEVLDDDALYYGLGASHSYHIRCSGENC